MAMAGLRRYAHKILDQEPVVAVSVVLGVAAAAMPLTIIPLRESMGYDTSQYYGRKKTTGSVGAALETMEEAIWTKEGPGIAPTRA